MCSGDHSLARVMRWFESKASRGTKESESGNSSMSLTRCGGEFFSFHVTRGRRFYYFDFLIIDEI